LSFFARQICQAVSTIAGVGAAGGFLLARHSNYRPLPFSEILLRMERELHAANKTVTRSVGKDGVVISTTTSQLVKRPPKADTMAGWVHDMRFRTRLFLRAARVPARFYFINVFCSAVILGAVTSVAQRVVCGRTGSDSEVGKGFAAMVAAKRKRTAVDKQQPQPQLLQSAPPPPVLEAEHEPINAAPVAQAAAAPEASKPVVLASRTPPAPLKPTDSPRDQTDGIPTRQ
jgi:hypothetical protein